MPPKLQSISYPNVVMTAYKLSEKSWARNMLMSWVGNGSPEHIRNTWLYRLDYNVCGYMVPSIKM